MFASWTRVAPGVHVLQTLAMPTTTALLDRFWPGRRIYLFDQACISGRAPAHRRGISWS
jgi:hypothetical protein